MAGAGDDVHERIQQIGMSLERMLEEDQRRIADEGAHEGGPDTIERSHVFGSGHRDPGQPERAGQRRRFGKDLRLCAARVVTLLQQDVLDQRKVRDPGFISEAASDTAAQGIGIIVRQGVPVMPQEAYGTRRRLDQA
jgi:hypothetical protein